MLIIVFSIFIITDINFAAILYNYYRMPEYEIDSHVSVIPHEENRREPPQLGERQDREEEKNARIQPQQNYAAIQLDEHSVDHALRKHDGNSLFFIILII